jgi:hypothetical protein
MIVIKATDSKIGKITANTSIKFISKLIIVYIKLLLFILFFLYRKEYFLINLNFFFPYPHLSALSLLLPFFAKAEGLGPLASVGSRGRSGAAFEGSRSGEINIQI